MLKFHSRSIAAFVAALAATTATVFAATPAPAAPATVETRATVVYRDLDLTRPEGLATLERRITGAVDRVCGSTTRLTIAERRDYRACVAAANAGAQVQLQLARRAAPIQTAAR